MWTMRIVLKRWVKPSRQESTVPVDLDILIVQVSVSPGRPEWFRDLVASVMKVYGVDKEVVASSLDDRPNLM